MGETLHGAAREVTGHEGETQGQQRPVDLKKCGAQRRGAVGGGVLPCATRHKGVGEGATRWRRWGTGSR
jgi:hypothetical protein